MHKVAKFCTLGDRIDIILHFLAAMKTPSEGGGWLPAPVPECKESLDILHLHSGTVRARCLICLG